MSGYIEKKVLLDMLCRENCGHDYEEGKCRNCYTASFIESVPEADVVPVVREGEI